VEEEDGAVREPEPVEETEPDPDESDDVDVTPKLETTLDSDLVAKPPVAEEAPLVSVAVTGQTVVVV
jgi:hypothetical protein